MQLHEKERKVFGKEMVQTEKGKKKEKQQQRI